MKKIIGIVCLSIVLMAFTEKTTLNMKEQTARTYYQVLDSGDVDRMKDLLSTKLIDHDGHGGDPVEEIKGLTLALKEGFTDCKHDIEILESISEDKIFVRWRMTAKHTGNFFGVSATQKNVNFVGHDLLRIEEGKLVEIWHVEDLSGMFRQLNTEP